MNKIFVLEKNTRDQIAAGEVAERPALIIKELVENSIDADATDIRIHLKEGGLSEIRLTDNGCGIDKEDIPYAFLRHATSKIKRIEDLDSLATMGFRGEALASIAAVSKISLKTKTHTADSGYQCLIEAGEIGEITSIGANDGTEIVISDLFFNTPARKKFLATPVREMREIGDIVGRIIIAHPHIRFELTNNGKRIFFAPGGGDIKTAIAGVYGTEMLKFLLPIDDNAVFTGFIAHPNYSKPNRNYYHFYINHRYIQSNELNKALENAYRTLLPERRFPVAFINVELPPHRYDINVHPNKLEVKFDKELALGDLLYEAVKSALESATKVYTTDIHSKLQAKEPVRPVYHDDNPPVPKIHQDLRPVGLAGAVERKREAEKHADDPEYLHRELLNTNRGKKQFTETAKMPTFDDLNTLVGNLPFAEQKPDNKRNLRTEGFKAKFHVSEEGAKPDAAFLKGFFTLNDSASSTSDSESESKNSEQAIDFNENFYSSLTILGQVGASFIAACNSEALYLIDQHAAHERLLFDKIKASVEKESPQVQPLLIPLELELNYRQYHWLIENILTLHKLGFMLEEFGENSFLLREIPTWAEKIDSVAFIKEFADGWLESSKPLSTETIIERKIMSKACKKAVKANWHLTNADIIYLFKELDASDEAFTCPHGRPITISFTIEEIRRKFLRS